MADYFLDVLGWTGKEYLIKAYMEDKALHLESDAEYEMIVNYIFPNLVFDSGAAIGWGSVLDIFNATHNGNVNNFRQAYDAAAPAANETMESWNKAWGSYTDA